MIIDLYLQLSMTPWKSATSVFPWGDYEVQSCWVWLLKCCHVKCSCNSRLDVFAWHKLKLLDGKLPQATITFHNNISTLFASCHYCQFYLTSCYWPKLFTHISTLWVLTSSHCWPWQATPFRWTSQRLERADSRAVVPNASFNSQWQW